MLNSLKLIVWQNFAGTLADVTFVQRTNTLGGVTPPQLFTLPAFGNIPNAQLAMPYQVSDVWH